MTTSTNHSEAMLAELFALADTMRNYSWIETAMRLRALAELSNNLDTGALLELAERTDAEAAQLAKAA